MSMFDDDKPIKMIGHELGADISMLSADELKARIILLTDEISRIEAEIASKSSSRTVAEDLFRK